MKRVLAAAVLVAFMPTANAQDQAKSAMTHAGEFRVRNTFEMNQSGNKNTKPTHENTIDQRFKLGLGFRANEKLAFNATLLQASAWGQGASTTTGNFGSAATSTEGQTGEENFISVNEAYATWMISDEFSLKFGRMNFGFGNGTVMSVNDWEQQPVSFEGVVGGYEAEFGKIQAFGFKYHDLNSEGGNTSKTSDPQWNAYGLVFDLKTMPEVLKSVNVFAIQDVSDATSTLDAQNELRLGASVGLAVSMIDFSATYVHLTGDSKSNATPEVKTDLEQSMMHAELGVNLPDLMGARFFVGYHQDSGDGDSTDDKEETYDSYFYERHANAGHMDIVGWGNLTNIYVGAMAKPMDDTTVGLTYHMFQKTEKTDAVVAGTYGDALFSGGTVNTDDKIGDEIDLWAQHNYDNGLTITARLGYFMPGGALDKLAPKRDEDVTQAMLEAKMTF